MTSALRVLAKHAQHVALIHLPIALFLTGVALDLAAQFTRRRDLAAAAYYNLTFAALSALPAAATGLLAWQWEPEGRRLKGILLYHLLAGKFRRKFRPPGPIRLDRTASAPWLRGWPLLRRVTRRQ